MQAKRGLGLQFLVVLFLLGCARLGSSQVEQGWQLSRNPGTSVTFIAGDYAEDVYDIEQGASSASFNTFDPYGNLISSRAIRGTVTSFVVDPYTGVAAFARADYAALDYWNGEFLGISYPNATVLGAGLDENDHLVIVYKQGSNVFFDT